MIAKWQKSTFQDHEQLHQDRHEVQPLVDNSDVQHQNCNLHPNKKYYSACRQCYKGFCEDCLHDQEIRVCDKADGLLIEFFWVISFDFYTKTWCIERLTSLWGVWGCVP